MKEYPILGELYSLIKDIPELQSFLEGICKDIEVVKNSIIYQSNNSIAEGSVNKPKVIKRIMYGRNSFELLKSKILLYEMMHH
jgi:transposase